MKISVIVPAFDEEESIRLLHSRVSDILTKDGMINGYTFELLFINDGSRDNTLDEIKQAVRMSESNTSAFSRNFGKEAAMLVCPMPQANCCLIMDSDLASPELIPMMIEQSKAGFDQVVAKRTGPVRG